MSKRPWMPLYLGDFLADTMHLGATERGIYISLLMHCWQHGTIPRDDRKLARISGCDSRLWHVHKGTVLQFFDVVDASTMQHSRVTSELHRYEKISNKRKAAAEQMHSKRDASAEHLQTHLQLQLHKKKKDAAPNGARQETSEEADLFNRGKLVLGKDAGGLIARLLKAKKQSVPLARAAIEQASTKQNPREYIGAVLRGPADERHGPNDPLAGII